MKKKHLTLLLLCMTTLLCFGQKSKSVSSPRYRVIKVNSTETVNMNYDGTNDVLKLQESVTFTDAYGKKHEYTPDSLKAFFLGDKSYYSFSFTYRGQTLKKFLNKCLDDSNNGIRMYAYYAGTNLVNFYVQKGEETTLYPANDNPQTGYISPIHEKFRELAGSKAESFEQYIEGTRMSPKRYNELMQKLTGKTITANMDFRWGVMAAAEYSSIKIEAYDLESAAMASGGLFADIPLIDNLTFHPEVLFSKYGINGKKESVRISTVAYNATVITVPMMLRYTFKSEDNKVFPYIQLGYQPILALNHKLEYAYLSKNVSSNHPDDPGLYTRYESGSEDLNKYLGNVIGGAGIEWAVSEKHSLFVDLRARFISSTPGYSGVMLSVSYNL